MLSEAARQLPKWRRVDKARFDEQLNILPPAIQEASGFLVGECAGRKQCRTTGKTDVQAFPAFMQIKGEYYECLGSLTFNEFYNLSWETVTENLEPAA